MKTLTYYLTFIFILSCMIYSPMFSQSAEYVSGQVLIKMKPEKSIAQKTALKNRMQATSRKAFSRLGIELWEVGNADISALIQQYKHHPDIEYIQPDYIYYPVTKMPDDPDISIQWGLNNIGQNGGTTDADIDAPEAWDIATGSPSIVLAIIDTGVDWAHEDLAENIWQNLGEDLDGDGRVLEQNASGEWVFDPDDINGVDDDGNGYPDDFVGWNFHNNNNNPLDNDDHGTHVAGIAGAKGNNDIGVAGVTWDVQLAALKFLDSGSGLVSNAIEAINYAVMMDMPISNNSWSGPINDQALYEAIEDAGQNGHLFVTAAGNDFRNNDLVASYPNSYDLDNIISVANTDRNDNLSPDSNYGAVAVDLGAPGTDIYSTFPNNSYSSQGGTSMSAPHVAGACALLWENHPDRTYTEIKEAILNTVDANADLNGKCVTNGRLNLYEAMKYFPPLMSLPLPSCRQEDSLSLVALYNATNGGNWVNVWNLNQPMTDWYGVTLTQDGCVKVLNIVSNGLNGTLPNDIGDLQDITYLNFSGNQLSGAIPGSIGNLPNLGYLDLSNNQINGNIPASVGNLQGLAFLLLHSNNLTGDMPVELSNMGDLGFLQIYNNALTGCYEEGLDVLCSQLITSSNPNISDGNNFDAPWEGFCATGTGTCTTAILPGDFDANGTVNQDDALYWGYAAGNTGPVRPNATIDCSLQISPEWLQLVGDPNTGNPLVNGKHQDGDGNGAVNGVDLQLIDDNYGCTFSVSPDAYIESTLVFEVLYQGLNGSGDNVYDVYVFDNNNNNINIHGIALEISFTNANYQNTYINTSGSSLGNHQSITGSTPDGIWVVLTRTDGNNVSINGPLFQLIDVKELTQASGEEFRINFRAGKVIADFDISTITNNTVYDIGESLGPASSNLVVTATVNHAQCNTFGTATVRPVGGVPPYDIWWNTGATTAEITGLTPGSYTATVTSSNGLSKSITVDVDGLMTEPYDAFGNLITCSTLDGGLCPTLLTPDGIVVGTHQAATAVNSKGIVTGGNNTTFKAGEIIILDKGFSVQPNGNLSAEIEDCN